MNKEQIIDLLLFLKDKEYRIDNENRITIWINFDDIQDFTKIFRRYTFL